MSLTRTDVKRGPRFSSTAPGRNPHPSPHSFDRLGPPFCGRVQSLGDGCRGSFFKLRPLDKDDAVPTVRKADAREMRGRPSRYTVQPPMSLTEGAYPIAKRF